MEQPYKAAYFKLDADSQIPRYIYGTAEKDDPNLIFEALEAGYRGIDSACQPQNYHEAATGAALARAFKPIEHDGLDLHRSQLWVQTKFTTPTGHTGLAPYDLHDSAAVKVSKSLSASLGKLGLSYVDVFLLHGLMSSMEETMEIWHCMEMYVGTTVRYLGICNVSLMELEKVTAAANIKPLVVQNRFWQRSDYNIPLRKFCRENSMVYQPFWVAKANQRLLESQLIGWYAESMNISRVDALFVLLAAPSKVSCNVCILTGSTKKSRLKATLETNALLNKVPSPVKVAFLKLLVEPDEDVLSD